MGIWLNTVWCWSRSFDLRRDSCTQLKLWTDKSDAQISTQIERSRSDSFAPSLETQMKPSKLYGPKQNCVIFWGVYMYIRNYTISNMKRMSWYAKEISPVNFCHTKATKDTNISFFLKFNFKNKNKNLFVSFNFGVLFVHTKSSSGPKLRENEQN